MEAYTTAPITKGNDKNLLLPNIYQALDQHFQAERRLRLPPPPPPLQISESSSLTPDAVDDSGHHIFFFITGPILFINGLRFGLSVV